MLDFAPPLSRAHPDAETPKPPRHAGDRHGRDVTRPPPASAFVTRVSE